MFNIFTNDLDGQSESSISKFADDTKLRDELDTSEGRPGL